MPKQLEITELGNPILREETKEVKNVLDREIKSLVDDMIFTVSHVNGVGLAAPQVSRSLQLFVMCSYPNERYPEAPELEAEAIINPEIISTSYEMELDWEGCLSIPKIRGLVPRYKSIDVRYTNISGKKIEKTFSDFPARIFQHEFDHLNGIVFLDRMESNQDIITENEYIKLINSQMEENNNE